MKSACFIFCMILIVSLCSEITSAETGIFGVSPSSIQFNNVIRGGYAERPIVVSYNQDQQIKIHLSAEGNIANWFNFTENITASKSNFAREVISVSPPSDVPNGNYTGLIVFSISSADGSSGGGNAVSKLISVLQIAVTVEVTDKEILACSARNFIINSAEKGDKVNFDLDVLNEGNIRIKPEVKIKVWDQEQNYVVKELEFTGAEILPTKENKVNFSISTDDLSTNQYWAYVETPQCYFTDTQPFDVLEPGAIKSNLILLRMYNNPFATVKETVPVAIEYENNGEKDVQAMFKGQISLNNKVVQLLESEPFISTVGELGNITLYFTPQKSGKYIISGRVFYDKKRTFESSSVINILDSHSLAKEILTVLVYVLIISVIVGLLLAIRRERREYKSKLSLISRK